MKYLLIIVLLGVILITAGCINENKNTVVVVIPTQTTSAPPIMVTTTVPFAVTSSISVQNKVTVYFFYGEECPHCHNVMPFMQNLSKKYPQVNFQILETWHNENNSALSAELNKKLGTQNPGVPEVIVTGNNTPLIGDRDIPAYLEGIILEQLKKQ